MLGIRISELPLYPDLSPSDLVPVAKGITTYKLPGTAFTTTGINVGNGTGIFSQKRFTTLEFCSLSGTGSLSINKTPNNTIVLSVPQINYVKTTAIGDGFTTSFSISGSDSNNPNNYRVDIDGALQEPGTSYSVLSGSIVFTEPPQLNSKVVILASPATNYYDVTPSDGSITPQKLSVNSIYWATNGNVGIGTTTPAYQLQLSTDSAAKPGSQLWTVASDERVKNIVRDYTKGLDAVCALKPVVFTYNGKGGTKLNNTENVSIIAQEAKNVFPECVSTYNEKLNINDTEVTELYNWNGNALIYALVNAVKELNQKIAVLEQKLTSLS